MHWGYIVHILIFLLLNIILIIGNSRCKRVYHTRVHYKFTVRAANRAHVSGLHLAAEGWKQS